MFKEDGKITKHVYMRVGGGGGDPFHFSKFLKIMKQQGA